MVGSFCQEGSVVMEWFGGVETIGLRINNSYVLLQRVESTESIRAVIPETLSFFVCTFYNSVK